MAKPQLVSNTAVKIERKVPMPPRVGGRGNYSSKYPWRQMEIGDSFLFEAGRAVNFCAAMASQTGKRIGRKFSIRKTAEGYRCWRTE